MAKSIVLETRKAVEGSQSRFVSKDNCLTFKPNQIPVLMHLNFDLIHYM